MPNTSVRAAGEAMPAAMLTNADHQFREALAGRDRIVAAYAEREEVSR